MSGLVKHSFSLAGHRTSVALEAEFWDVLRDAASICGLSLGRLVAEADAARSDTRPLASALRLLALAHAGRRAAPPFVPADSEMAAKNV